MSFYSIPPLLSALLFFAMGIFVLSKNVKSPTNRIFAWSCLTTFIWQFAWTIMFSIKTTVLAPLLVKIGYSGIIFIPVAFYHFTMTYLHENRERKLILTSYFLSTVFLIAIWTSKLFVNGYYSYFWGNYPRASILHPFYLFLLFFLSFRGLWILSIKARQFKTTPLSYNQIKYLFFAFVIYCFASTDFVVNYGIGFYPLGFIFIIISDGLISYAIVRHHLMDIDVVIKKTIIFGGLATFVSGITIFSAYLGARLIGGGNVIISAIITGLITSLLVEPLRKWLINITENFLFQKEYNQQEILDVMTRGATGKVDLEELKNTITKVTADAMKLEDAFIIEKDEFKNRATIDRQQKAGISIPIFLNNEIYWILFLGEKKSGKAFTKEDKNTLQSFSQNISLIIANAKFQMDALRQKNLEFISVLVKNLAHEIFNPLTPLQHSVENLEGEEFLKIYEIYERYKDKYSKEDETLFKEALIALREATKSIKTNAQHIQLIVDTLNKMQKGDEKTIGPVDIKMFFKEVISILGMEVDADMQKGVVVEQHIDRGFLPVTGNPTLLKQVFINLYKNACYAMKSSAEKIIRISCNMNEANDNELLIEFSDTGAGISAETLTKLFTYGFTTKGSRGSGIGLNQCKIVIEKFGGNITVKSEVGRGTTFTVMLPVWKEA